jgi:hypothetical protein
MARAFVIRPFGTKKDSAGREFDFEAVQAKVITPALVEAGLAGTTTGEIIDAGNIREDMFSLILEADLVICDITLLNANVFYELGMRHALRRRCTLLIKQVGSADSPPFDLLTDRYLVYDLADPEAKTKLLRSIERTLQSDRKTDSPIFAMLPDLPEADPAAVQIVPLDFRQEVDRAREARSKGWLRLLAQDVRGQRFERSGLQLIADGQWDLRDYEGARETLDAILKIQPDEVAANLVLANVHERLHRDDKQATSLLKSDQALERVLTARNATLVQQVEALALQGRNQKTRWRREFGRLTSVEERRATAMNQSLRECFNAYRAAYAKDLNHFWSGLAALQMGAIFLDLSETDDAWKSTFDDDTQAETYRRDLTQDVTALRYVVTASVDGALARLPASHADRIWAEVSKVDVLFLTDQNEQRVVKRYRDTIPLDKPFVWDAVRGQLQLFADLGVRAGRAEKVIEEINRKFATASRPITQPIQVPLRVVVFAGHQIDRPDRQQPRFPAARAEHARGLIRDALAKLVADGWETRAYASASPGGDLLFHEVCEELKVRSAVCLPMPAEEYSRQTFGNLDDWRSRFLALCERNRDRRGAVLELSDQAGPPRWLHGTPVDPWERGYRWVLQIALASGAERITLLALWDGKADGEGAGSTAHMVQLARDAGKIDVKVIETTELR